MAVPKVLRSVWKVWMTVSHAIGVVMSSIILTVLWIVLFGAYAICLKCAALFKRTPTHTSSWQDIPREHKGFINQF